MLDFYFIRHAESEANRRRYLIGGRSNHSPLSPQGIYQADRLRRRFIEERRGFDKVYSSTARRALETAQVSIGGAFPFRYIFQRDELLELDQGEFEGMPRAEIYTPERLTEIKASEGNYRPPRGESQRDVERRMMEWVEIELLRKQQEDLRVGIFGHGVAFKCLFRGIFNFDQSFVYERVLDNASISHLRYGSNGWHLVTLNDTGHL